MKSNTCLSHRRFWVTAILPAFVLIAFTVAQSQAINVSTRNYNNQRTGANLSETFLTTTSVRGWLLRITPSISAGRHSATRDRTTDS